MAVDHVKSTPITNLDANPVVPNTAGEGGPAPLVSVSSGDVVGVAASSVNATYQFVRVPSNCKIKQILFDTETQAAGAIDIGLYYATDGEGGKPTALLAAAAIDQDFFASAVTITAVAITDVTNESGTYTPLKRNQPLWQAVGLSSDPGGYFDIVGTVTTAITTGTGKMGMTVNFTV
jgi:hypothetical protein